MEKEDIIFIEHILDSINAIENFSKDISKEELISNRLKQSAIVREIEIVGEAVKNISKKLKKKHTEVEWKDIVGTRDKMIHHYFSVDINVIWEIVKTDIPELKSKVLKIKKEIMDK
ncbi:DUF86 domain-containing protein [Candidatus Pacearchaeota archaeon]|nr:DUF86 domain-containing protein [Candidatus Pacearchaeota archaeon]